MDYRRIPFQFTTTDPLKRQEELQKRFGISVNKGNMFVDSENSGPMKARSNMNSASNSPRLQHRVPIFVEGQSESMKPSVEAQNVDSGKKPRVRVIPIEIEGDHYANKRQHWFSGSSEPVSERFNNKGASIPAEKYPSHVPSSQSSNTPRVCNIPVKIEGRDQGYRPNSPIKTQKVRVPESPKHTGTKLNGCSASKGVTVNEKKNSPKASDERESPEQTTLKKIHNVEEKLKGYQSEIENFSGSNKEKQYRFLDEMLTRCMLELDEIDTMGLETIRLARKAAVKKVQASLDLLESKVTREDKQPVSVLMEVESSHDQTLENGGDVDEKVESIETEKTAFAKTDVGNEDSGKTGNATVEMTDTLPEVINEKVENISIMDMDTNKPVDETMTDEKFKIDEMEQTMQITEVEAGVETVAASDTEPVIEEPLSCESQDENADMDLDSCNNENESKCDENSFQISEVVNDELNPNKLETEAGQLDQNLKMEVTEISNIPVVEQTVLSDNKLVTVEQSST